MKKFEGILICTDLDGTLLNSRHTVSRENREAIEYFKAEGGLFTFITGRMPYYAVDAYNAVEPNVAFGCVNGGGLYDGEGRLIGIVNAKIVDDGVENIGYAIPSNIAVSIAENIIDKSLFIL